MPEAPEIYNSAKFINRVCSNRIFVGKITKSEVSWKKTDIDWDSPYYTVTAQSRGKELKLTVRELLNISDKDKDVEISSVGGVFGKFLDIIFHFGMSGCFTWTEKEKLNKHAHLHFHARDDSMVLSFLDVRRFGNWEVKKGWSEGRGPCPILESDLFRQNVLQNLASSVFDKPICEVLLNQKFFNGIGNYLRSEILFRLSIAPFTSARTVMENISKDEVKREKPDILDMCCAVPKEVIALGSSEDPNKSSVDYSALASWLRCYNVQGMNNMFDHQKRTVWFSGKAGPLAPTTKDKKIKRKKLKSKVETSNDFEEESKTEFRLDKQPRKTKSEKIDNKSQDNVKHESEEKNTRKKSVKERKAVESNSSVVTRSTRLRSRIDGEQH